LQAKQGAVPDVPRRHETVRAPTKARVKRVLVNLNICPVTESTVVAGRRLGNVGIPVVCQLQADTWEAIRAMLPAGPGI
jgi:hypothetical protein